MANEKNPYRQSPEVIEKQVFVEKIKSRKLFEELKIMLKAILEFADQHTEASVISLFLLLCFPLALLAIIENYHGRNLHPVCQDTISIHPPVNSQMSCLNNQILNYNQQEDTLLCRCK